MTCLAFVRRRLPVGCILLAAFSSSAAATLRAEDMTQTYTRAQPPQREALERLNLKLGWSLYLPVEGLRDGLSSVQPFEKDILVQTRSGLVVVVDSDTGKTKWRARVGRAYHVSQALGYNRSAIFVVRETVLYALDRDDGKVLWQTILPDVPSAQPVADEEQMYLVFGAKMNMYLLPTRQEMEDFAKGAGPAATAVPVPSAYDAPKEGPKSPLGVKGTDVKAFGPLTNIRLRSEADMVGAQPHLLGEFNLASRVESALLRTSDTLLLPGTDGVVSGMGRINTRSTYRVPLDAGIALQPGQFAETGYIAAQDQNLYAMNIDTGRVLWRFTDGTLFSQAPAVNDQSVFLATPRRGLYSLERETGLTKWRSPDAGRFLAANPKFVYAADRSNRFLVLDRERGTKLSTYDLREFVFPVANERTDRIYLAAHNGLLVSLYDRDYEKPLVLKREVKPQAPPDTGKPADAPPPSKEKPNGAGDREKPKEPGDKSKNDKEEEDR